MTNAIYSIPGYLTVYHTPDGKHLTIRPMLPTDREALLDFFRRISPDDRLYLKDDVTSPAVITRWAETLDYRRDYCCSPSMMTPLSVMAPCITAGPKRASILVRYG
jgi:hypothetical protein